MKIDIGGGYTRASLAELFDLPRLALTREGVVTHGEHVILFVTLDKAGQANTQLHYNDFFENTIFHWDSQNTQHYGSPVIQNMVLGRVTIHLFARIHQKVRGITQPFFYCGHLGFRSYEASTSYPVHLEFDVLDFQLNPGPALKLLYSWRPSMPSQFAQASRTGSLAPATAPSNPAPLSAESGSVGATGAAATAPVTRLSAQVLAAATPEFIWLAIQGIIAGRADHRFGPSTDYDVITDDGRRLPPKAVFGVALALALQDPTIGPEHFSAGEASSCFRLLREAGYAIISKSSPTGNVGGADEEDREWKEGEVKLGPHRRRERSPGLARAKKAQFLRQHGKLFCEHCELDPVAVYGTLLAESCIEVHHRDTQVQDMAPGHVTRLRHLICICANCHRLEHRRIATAAACAVR